MFNQQKSAVLPAPQAVDDLEADTRQKQFAIPDDLYDRFQVPVKYREALNKLWLEELSKKRELKRGYRVVMYCLASQLGGVWLEAFIKNNVLELWLEVGDPELKGEFDENGEPEFLMVSAADMQPQMPVGPAGAAPTEAEEQAAWLKKVWIEFNPVQPLKAEKKIQPNAKCPCGCGKKFKKHLGREA